MTSKEQIAEKPDFRHLLAKISTETPFSKLTRVARLLVPSRYRFKIRHILGMDRQMKDVSTGTIIEKHLEGDGEHAFRAMISTIGDADILVRTTEQQFEQEIVAVFNSAAPGTTFLDIGSANGVYSLAAAAHGILTFSIDAFKPALDSLGKSVAQNDGFDGLITSIHTAVGSEKGTLTLNYDSQQSLSPALSKSHEKFDRQVDVRVTTIDALIEEETIPFPSILKMDIEGAEVMAIEGAKKLLVSENKPRHIFIELHIDSSKKMGGNIYEVGQKLLNYGYTLESAERCPAGYLCHFTTI